MPLATAVVARGGGNVLAAEQPLTTSVGRLSGDEGPVGG